MNPVALLEGPGRSPIQAVTTTGEARMDKSLDLFRDICDNAEDLIQSVAPDGRFLYANAAWHRILGYTDEDLKKTRLFDVIHPSSRDHCAALLREVLTGPAPVHIEAVFKTKDGRKVDVEGSTSCRFEGGKPVATRTILRDVTARNQARDQLERLFKLSLDLLCVAGVDGYFKKINPAFTRVLGYSQRELLSRRFVEFIHPEDRAATDKEIERLANGQEVVDFVNRYLAADGTYRWLAWRSAPMQELGLIYAVARDVTESRRIERLIKRQAEELSRSNADLEQFAYVASHDLRAPMRAMANLADWIEEDMPGQLPEKVRGHLEKLRRRLEHLERMTESILEHSRAGSSNEAATRIDTALLVKDLGDELAPPPGFRVVPAFGLPGLETARAPIEQVFRNLIGNAIKHRDRDNGRVEVSARDLGDQYEFRVEDDGPGIPPAERETIFQMFHRLGPAETIEGSGIGLALVKRIVERHGGLVRVEPREGRGAAFIFTWPKKLWVAAEDDAPDTHR